LEAFIDHGKVRNALEAEVDLAHRQLADLEAVNISLDRVTVELEAEGVEAFAESYRQLLATLRESAAAAGAGGEQR